MKICFFGKRSFILSTFFLVSTFFYSNIGSAQNVECVVLDESNWDEFAPTGKEVDAIYGDIVLRNKRIIAVIGNPVAKRNANMTVRDVGGAVIDLTLRDQPNDQLSCFYPGGKTLTFHELESLQVSTATNSEFAVADFPCQSEEGIEVTLKGKTAKFDLPVTSTYRLSGEQSYLEVTTEVTNNTEGTLKVERRDSIRADRTFINQTADDKKLISVYDPWFHQAYGVVAFGDYPEVRFSPNRDRRKIQWNYSSAEESESSDDVEAGKSVTWSRRLIPAEDPLKLDMLVREASESDQQTERLPVKISITDGSNGIRYARVVIRKQGRFFADARTDISGRLTAQLEPAVYSMVVTADGRERLAFSTVVDKKFESNDVDVVMDRLATIKGTVTDAEGQPIACKISFNGVEQTPDPFFGPDSLAEAVQNVIYTPNGQFEQQIGPGRYEIVVSHGPEYDADIHKLEVERGAEYKLESKLARTVDTTGWISTEFHSHSSESGDNTSDQFGRVLNLLAENIEFAPCTEHNRIDSYAPHLERVDAVDRLATCSGIELTGSPLPINHQNAFPMIMKPRTQDGGGPRTHGDPTVQIERLKFWDDNSDKLMQMNHPNLIAILADRDSDNQADAGFKKMFGFVDVVEIHPLSKIFDEVTELPQPGKNGNVIFNWMQLLNQGYRIPGVINADAHYNFHGSGFRRNFVKCSTDDPASIDTMEIVRNSRAGRVVMSNGPFLSVMAEGESPTGETVKAEIGDEVVMKPDSLKLQIKVQSPNWLDVDRVQVIVNGRLIPELNFSRRDAKDKFSNDVIKFDQTIEVPLKEDSHVMVVTAGERHELGKVMGPVHGLLMPIAMSNPIFIDVDGNGFEANKDTLGAPILLPASSE